MTARYSLFNDAVCNWSCTGPDDEMKMTSVRYWSHKKFWEELIAYFPFIRHGPHRKRCARIPLFLYALFAAVTFLPSRCLATIGGIHRLMGGIYEVCHWDGLRCHDIHAKVHKRILIHSKVDGWGADTQTKHGDRMKPLSFLENKGSWLKKF
jgi:hypothetical protein